MRRKLLNIMAVVSAGILAATGCHRSFYREQADAESYGLIGEKASHPHWSLDRFSILPDPTSRMADFDSPDGPPMPPDDPAAHKLMHNVDHKPGYPFWHINGDTGFVENPNWKSFLPLDEDGVLHLDTETAVKLALVHSPDYQTSQETLYLAALDVSAERFVFDPQVFAGFGVAYDAVGRLAGNPDVNPNTGLAEGTSRSNLSTRTTGQGGGWQVNRAFTTGANLVVNFANMLIWRFSGADTHSANSLISFELMQPLLRDAGRDKIMESLTLAERNLLAGVRQLERFRRGFYLDIAMGNGVQAAPARGGGALGGQFGIFGGGAGGVLGLLQTKLAIGNQETNLNALRSSLVQLEGLSKKPPDQGGVSLFQVDQTRQQVTQSTTSLLAQKRAYRDSVDVLKRQLGLPPDLEVVIDDDRLDVVNLTPPEIQSKQNRVKALRERVSGANLEILSKLRSGEEFQWSEELKGNLEDVLEELKNLNAVCAEVLTETSDGIRKDIARLREAVPKRKEFTKEIRAAIARAKEGDEDSLLADVDPTIFNLERLYGLRQLYPDQTQREISLDELPDYLSDWLDTVTGRFSEIVRGNNEIANTINQVLEKGPAMENELLRTVVDERIQKPNPNQFNLSEANTIELLLISAMARSETLMMPKVDIRPAEALKIARIFRRDWMNARASLVDSWRLIEFNADDLESVLDIVFTGDIGNRGDNPLRFRDVTGSLGVGVQFDAPLTRLLERNAYRESLIRYQQARRAYYQVGDQISQSLRSIIRRIEFNKADFEVRRTSLRVAVAQVRSARAEIEKPPSPEGGGGLSPTASLDLINSLSSLNSAQDQFIEVWVNFEVQRALLDLQMGTMRLDETGQWVDPGDIGLKYGYPSSDALQAVPEYVEGLPCIDDLIYKPILDGQYLQEGVGPFEQDGLYEPNGLEEVPAPPPGGFGPQNELEMVPAPGNPDLTQTELSESLGAESPNRKTVRPPVRRASLGIDRAKSELPPIAPSPMDASELTRSMPANRSEASRNLGLTEGFHPGARHRSAIDLRR